MVLCALPYEYEPSHYPIPLLYVGGCLRNKRRLPFLVNAHIFESVPTHKDTQILVLND